MCSKRTDTHAQTHTHTHSTHQHSNKHTSNITLTPPHTHKHRHTHAHTTHPHTHTPTHLEVAVLVDGAPGVRAHPPGGDVQVLAGEQEEVHAAALSYTVLGQLLVHALHRVEQRLIGRQTHQSVNRSTNHSPLSVPGGNFAEMRMVSNFCNNTGTMEKKT